MREQVAGYGCHCETCEVEVKVEGAEVVIVAFSTTTSAFSLRISNDRHMLFNIHDKLTSGGQSSIRSFGW